jgi:cytochrome c oxidase cbb3-type subunit 4
MDINDLRGILTAIIFFAFIGIWVWAWSSRRKKDFEASAELPLEEDQYITTNSNIERENI